MRLKVTLRGPGTARDVLVVADATATVGAVAERLARSDPAGSTVPEGSAVTLRTTDVGAGAGASRRVSPSTTLVDAGIRSGSVVDLVEVAPAFDVPGQDRGAAAAVLTVVQGPDAGREFPLPSGSSVVGRDRTVDVRLSDPLVSKSHARLNVADTVEILDLNSSNGVVVGGGLVTRAALTSADEVTLGDTVLRVVLLHRPDSRPTGATTVEHIRPPRYVPRYPGSDFVGPTPPKPPQGGRFPYLALVAPLVVGAVLFVLTRQLLGVVMMGMSPVLLVGAYFDQRISGRRQLRRDADRFGEAMSRTAATLEKARNDERTVRLAEAPSLRETTEAIERLGPLLWANRPEHPSFLTARLGLGRETSRNRLVLPAANDTMPDYWHQLEQLALDYSTVDGVPITVPLRVSGALGLAGPRDVLDGVARGVVLGLVGLHSPAELVMTAFTSPASAGTWGFLPWLPHVGSVHSPLTGAHLASGPAAAAGLLSRLEELVAARGVEAASPRGPLDPAERLDVAQPVVPSIVVVVEDDAPVDRSRLTRLAERGADADVHVIWCAPRFESLPGACRSYLTVDSTASGAVSAAIRTGDRHLPVTTESLAAADAERLARSLAPVIDVGVPEEDDSDLPREVSYAALAGPGLLVDPGLVVERWKENGSLTLRDGSAPVRRRTETTLRALVGNAGSEPFHLDLRIQGPHALVGGTTGAGKSEFLQSWVLGMAAAYSPDHVTFLFVDYKGGSAFADCLRLPHTVGLVTDLSPHLVRRALTSLRAELRYREHLLARKGAKDLVSLERTGDPDCPPSLVIVVDEFAALVHDVPEFVDGVVDVAQRGRSLGLHLVLATQRPAGVIKDNLRGNTNLRIALRMADAEDSTDILGTPVAAGFDPGIPGRGMAKSGPGRLTAFQSGYAGGWTTAEPAPASIEIRELGFGDPVAWPAPELAAVDLVDPGPTDIARMVSTIAGAAAEAGVPAPRKPWLDVLADLYDLKRLPKRRSDERILIGVRDDPASQAQPTVHYEPDRDGNLAIIGSSGSGKSAALRTIAASSAMTLRGGPVQVYALDFGAAGLRMLDDLPHVGAVIDGDDEERVIRLLRMLRDVADERAAGYAGVRADTIGEYRALAAAPDEPRILLLVDGIQAFRDAYEFAASSSAWFTVFTQIAADGRKVGVHVVMTGDRPNSIPPSISSTVQRRIVLRLATEEDYLLVGAPRDVLDASSPPGRGVVDGDEIQLALLGASQNLAVQAREMHALAQSLERAGVVRPAPVERLAERIPRGSVGETWGGRPVVAVSDGDLGPAVVEPRGAFLVSGPPSSGRTTALRTLVSALARAEAGRTTVLFGPRRGILADDILWARTAFGAAAIAAEAQRLLDELAAGTAPDSLVVVVESAADFTGTEAEFVLESLVRTLVREGHFAVGESESSAWQQAYSLREAFKTWRSGLLLVPGEMDGDTLLGTSLGRLRRADFPPGRGFLVRQGRPEKVQVIDAAP